MTVTSFIAAARSYFKQWFHQRNVIIVSEHKVKHIPISGNMQFFALVLAAGLVCWASYSTGNAIAARSVIKERTQALRSVTGARVQDNLTSLLEVAPSAKSPSASASIDYPMKDMMFSAGNDNGQLLNRIAFLEHKVAELTTTNDTIVQRVQDKTLSKIAELETIIQHTGLNEEELKKQVSENMPPKPAHQYRTGDAEGGPYIPENTPLSPQLDQMFSNLDTLTVLSNIVGTLPLGVPIQDAERRSPFGHRIDPFTGHLAFHSGVDLAGPFGADIHSTGDGKVVSAGVNGSYGNSVDIDHGFGIVTRYGHLSKILVQEGQDVHKGDLIGLEGSTGRSTGPHLHYEVRYNDVAMNPVNFLDAGRYVAQE